MKHKTTLRLLTMATLFFAMGVKAQENYEDGVVYTFKDNIDPYSENNESHEMDGIVVTGTRDKTDASNVVATVTVLDRNQLTQQQQVSLLPTLSQLVPGVFVTSRGFLGYGVSSGAAGNISVRGLGSGEGRVLVLIDGHPQYQGIFGHSLADSYMTQLAERVEVVRGPASTLYGSNALGGVVNIITRRMKEEGVHTEAGLATGFYNTLQADAYNQIHKGFFSSNIGVQYNRSDNNRENMGFEEYGGFAKLAFDLGPYWNLSIDANAQRTNASNPGPLSKPVLDNRFHITRGVANVVISNMYDATNGAVSVYGNFGRHRIDDGHVASASAQTKYFRSKDYVVGVNAYQTVSLLTGNRTTFGFDYQRIYGRAYYTSKTTDKEVSAGKSATEQHFDDIAAYVDYRQDIGKYFTLDAAFRFDYRTQVGGEAIPMGGFIIRPCRTGEIKATVSKGYRAPTMKEMFLYGSANEDLRPERLMSYEVAWKHSLFSGRIQYGINAFFLHADNLIQTVSSKNVNTGEVKNAGFEADLTWSIGRHTTFTTNHSYLHMENPVVAAPQYKGFVGLDLQFDEWMINAGFQQLVGLYTNVKAKKKENVSLLSLMVGYKMGRFLVYARGENLLAQKYEINEGYPMPSATCLAGVRVSF